MSILSHLGTLLLGFIICYAYWKLSERKIRINEDELDAAEEFDKLTD